MIFPFIAWWFSHQLRVHGPTVPRVPFGGWTLVELLALHPQVLRWMGQRNPINHQFGMVETLEIMGCLPPFSTGAGFRNHPQYAVHEYSLYMQCTHAVHDFGRFWCFQTWVCLKMGCPKLTGCHHFPHSILKPLVNWQFAIENGNRNSWFPK